VLAKTSVCVVAFGVALVLSRTTAAEVLVVAVVSLMVWPSAVHALRRNLSWSGVVASVRTAMMPVPLEQDSSPFESDAKRRPPRHDARADRRLRAPASPSMKSRVFGDAALGVLLGDR
jgi:hypothetical protein